ncbi:UQCRX like ubiquinol-cytochrome C reductase family protein [Penicillium sp. IBT 16267x]|nr:UQCRX like ubiquinol-cytochrome C reductase family protein [Penicillium sp. IBT 16267x]
MSGISNAIYQHVSPPSIRSDGRNCLLQNAVYLTAIFAGAFAFEIGFDTASNKIWDSWNAGRQWKDIKPRYLTAAAEEDDE